MVMQNDGDSGLWSHGNKQLPESFCGRFGIADATGKSPLPGRGCSLPPFRVPHSAIRISHPLLIRHRRTDYWTALRDYRFVIYFWLGGAKILAFFPLEKRF